MLCEFYWTSKYSLVSSCGIDMKFKVLTCFEISYLQHVRTCQKLISILGLQNRKKARKLENNFAFLFLLDFDEKISLPTFYHKSEAPAALVLLSQSSVLDSCRQLFMRHRLIRNINLTSIFCSVTVAGSSCSSFRKIFQVQRTGPMTSTPCLSSLKKWQPILEQGVLNRVFFCFVENQDQASRTNCQVSWKFSKSLISLTGCLEQGVLSPDSDTCLYHLDSSSWRR